MRPIRIAVFAAGLATAAQAHAQTEPVSLSRLGSHVSADDYPAEAVRHNEQGTVRFRLDVGAQGEVRGCSILATSGSKSLDETTCRIMTERARFQPATDQAGRARPSAIEHTITWRLEERAVLPRLNALTSLWIGCVFGEMAKLVPLTVAADQIADQAFRACVQNEVLAVAEWKSAGPPGTQPRKTIDGLKGELRLRMDEQIEQVRRVLSVPAELR